MSSIEILSSRAESNTEHAEMHDAEVEAEEVDVGPGIDEDNDEHELLLVENGVASCARAFVAPCVSTRLRFCAVSMAAVTALVVVFFNTAKSMTALSEETVTEIKQSIADGVNEANFASELDRVRF